MKVNEKRRRAVVMMRLNGMTYQEIGETLGVTAPAAQQMVARMLRMKGAVPYEYVYPRIAQWMNETETNVKELAKMAGIKYETLYRALVGKTKNMRVDHAIAIAKAMGMTVEEAFSRE